MPLRHRQKFNPALDIWRFFFENVGYKLISSIKTTNLLIIVQTKLFTLLDFCTETNIAYLFFARTNIAYLDSHGWKNSISCVEKERKVPGKRRKDRNKIKINFICSQALGSLCRKKWLFQKQCLEKMHSSHHARKARIEIKRHDAYFRLIDWEKIRISICLLRTELKRHIRYEEIQEQDWKDVYSVRGDPRAFLHFWTKKALWPWFIFTETKRSHPLPYKVFEPGKHLAAMHHQTAIKGHKWTDPKLYLWMLPDTLKLYQKIHSEQDLQNTAGHSWTSKQSGEHGLLC